MRILSRTLWVTLGFFFFGFSQAAVAGQEMVFSSYKSGSWQIWAINPETKIERQLTREQGDLRFPRWSPDRERIAFATNGGKIRIMDSNGLHIKTLELLEGKCDQPAWHPSGTRLVYTSFTYISGEDSDLWEVPLAKDKEFRPSRLNVGEGIEQFPAYGPKGDRLMYSRFHRNQWRQVVEELWIRDMKGGREYALARTGRQTFYPDWSPDGRSVVFASNMTGDYEIWLLKLQPAGLIRLTNNPGLDTQPCWSPDGKRIAFISTRSGNKQIWVMDREGRETQQVSRGPAECKDPDW